jgi:hypothetical protein
MLQLLDLEQALATAETLAAAAERLTTGEGVSGPAAGHYIAAANEFQNTYAGGFLTKRQHKALIANPRLQIFDHPESFLTCNYDPHTALCNPARGKADATAQRTPSHNRFQSACPNISLTDAHMDLAAAEAERITAEISDGLLPHLIRRRLEQRRQSLNALITDHRTSRIINTPRAPMPDTTPPSLAETIGTALTIAAEAADGGNAEDRTITDAMIRLLAGVPLHSDGQLTIKSLAAEAQLKRHKLTHKHTGIKDLFYALVRSQDHRPRIADRLQEDNDRLREQLATLREEHRRLKDRLATFARVIQVLEVENQGLRSAGPGGVVRPLPRREA